MARAVREARMKEVPLSEIKNDLSQSYVRQLLGLQCPGAQPALNKGPASCAYSCLKRMNEQDLGPGGASSETNKPQKLRGIVMVVAHQVQFLA